MNNSQLCPRLQEVQNSIEGNRIMNDIIDRTERVKQARQILTSVLSGRYIGKAQEEAIREALKGDDWQFFADKINELVVLIGQTPRTYQNPGKGDETMCYLHYFKHSFDAYITEIDIIPDLNQCFGYADLGFGPELGYISLPELLANGVELDLHFEPRPWSQICC